MIDSILSWHPIFVHFTFGLISVAVFFYFLSYIMRFIKLESRTIAIGLEIAGRWCLWTDAAITILTIASGFHAHNVIIIDKNYQPTLAFHRNLSIIASIAIFLIAAWSICNYYKQQAINMTFLFALFIKQVLMLYTGSRGNVLLVFSHGVGVKSLPKEEIITSSYNNFHTINNMQQTIVTT